MLVLSRKAGQELVINGNIRITINRISGSRVTLGISAPKNVRVVRGELEAIVHAFDAEESEDSLEEPPASPPIVIAAKGRSVLQDLLSH